MSEFETVNDNADVCMCVCVCVSSLPSFVDDYVDGVLCCTLDLTVESMWRAAQMSDCSMDFNG